MHDGNHGSYSHGKITKCTFINITLNKWVTEKEEIKKYKSKKVNLYYPRERERASECEMNECTSLNVSVNLKINYGHRFMTQSQAFYNFYIAI